MSLNLLHVIMLHMYAANFPFHTYIHTSAWWLDLLSYWLIDWIIYLFISSFIDWLIDWTKVSKWMIGCLISWFIYFLFLPRKKMLRPICKYKLESSLGGFNPSSVQSTVLWVAHLFPHIGYVLAKWVLLNSWIPFLLLQHITQPHPISKGVKSSLGMS